MSKPRFNPFQPNRFEHANRPIIWLSPTATELEGAQNVFVEGTRGSGKTSLLASLHWQQRLENETLNVQLEGNGGFRRFLAVYLKMPEFLTRAFNEYNWTRVFPNQPAGTAEEQSFQLFLQLGVLHEVVFALSVLIDRRIYDVEGPKHEYFKRTLAPILKAIEPLCSRIDSSKLDSTESMLDFIAAARDFFCLIHIRDITEGDFAQILFHLANRLLSAAIPSLLAQLGGRSATHHIKICLDEAESLLPYQQLALNSLVRNSQAPIYYVLSFVSGGYDSVQTSLRAMSLSDADRRTYVIDEASDAAFLRSCEQVSAFRFWYAEQDEDEAGTEQPGPSADYFQVREILGATSINELIHQLLGRSLSKEFPALLARTASGIANDLSGAEFRVQPKGSAMDAFVEREGPFNLSPYWQAYTLLRLNRLHHPKNATSKIARARLAASLRRKQRAALLLVCWELGVRVPYSGWQVALALSDKCIRDYLDIMAAIYDGYAAGTAKKPKDFRNSRIPTEIQRGAIVRSSRKKLEGIAQNALRHQRESFKLVACLGELQKRLQLGPTPADALRTPEIGVFNVHLSTSSNEDALARAVINECETHGYIKLVNTSGAQLTLTSSGTRAIDKVEYSIRLHRRFAPFFGYSYRGPYHSVELASHDIHAICGDPDNIDPFAWANRVAARLRNNEGQSSLL